jgi:hypothetical protein
LAILFGAAACASPATSEIVRSGHAGSAEGTGTRVGYAAPFISEHYHYLPLLIFSLPLRSILSVFFAFRQADSG